MPKKKSVSATPFCRVCFKDIRPNSFKAFLTTDNRLCRKCYQGLEPSFFRFKLGSISFMAIYPYHEGFQSLLFQFKGCFDIELAPIFLEFPLPWLKLLYHGCYLIPAPSSASHNQTRGFNHVVEAFRPLGLPILEILEKTSDRKQTDCSLEERKTVGDIIRLTKKPNLKGKKVLFVDDVFTTGSTAKACLKLIASLHPKKLQGLVLSKVIPK